MGEHLSGIVKTKCMSLEIFISFVVVEVEIRSNASLEVVVVDESG